jgi:hypothetical protein
MLALMVITQPARRPATARTVPLRVRRASAVMPAPARSVNAVSSSRPDWSGEAAHGLDDGSVSTH